jgi:hypothetical protein
MANLSESEIRASWEAKSKQREYLHSLSSTDRLLVVLARCPNPDTGRIYTDAELAGIFHYSPKKVQEILIGVGYREVPFSEVKREELPENERAFFMGLALGDYQVSRVNREKQDFVVVGTESLSAQKRGLLKHTIGRRGQISESARELRIYVASPEFDFVTNPPVDAKFLDAKIRFAPFLLGMLASRLSNQENRVSLQNKGLLERIHKGFESHFGFSMGNFGVKERKDGPDTPSIQVKNPGEVFAALIQVQSVSSLPFLADVARLSAGPR